VNLDTNAADIYKSYASLWRESSELNTNLYGLSDIKMEEWILWLMKSLAVQQQKWPKWWERIVNWLLQS